MEYAELREVCSLEGGAQLKLGMFCPKRGWYWLEKFNSIASFFRASSRRSSADYVQLLLDGVTYIREDLSQG